MYAVHTTEGLVVGKRGVGEANVLVYVLTHELGLVRAAARSSRREGAKLKGGIEPLVRARFAFVRGRSEWRLVQVVGPRNLFARSAISSRAAAGRVSQLLLRLIHGQEANPALFADVSEGFALLSASTEPQAVEVILVLRILSHLGYLPHTQTLAPFVDQEFSIELSAQALAQRALLVRTINEALRATGL